jgi:hypothetical protein
MSRLSQDHKHFWFEFIDYLPLSSTLDPTAGAATQELIFWQFPPTESF